MSAYSSRGVCRGLRRRIPRRRRDRLQPDGAGPAPGRAARAGDLRAGPPAVRRRGLPGHTRRDGRRVAAVPRRVRRRRARDAARDDGREPDRSLRQPEHLRRRRLAEADRAAARLARGAWQHGQPHHQLLGAEPLATGVRRAGRLRLGRGLRPRRGARRSGPVPRDPRRRHEPRSPGLRDPRPLDAAAFRASGRDRRRGRRGDRVRPRARTMPPRRGCRRDEELRLIREVLDPKDTRSKEVPG